VSPVLVIGVGDYLTCSSRLRKKIKKLETHIAKGTPHTVQLENVENLSAKILETSVDKVRKTGFTAGTALHDAVIKKYTSPSRNNKFQRPEVEFACRNKAVVVKARMMASKPMA
jgi:hypothetical protein